MKAKNLSIVHERNPFIAMVQSGATPEEIHELIVEIMLPYLTDKDIFLRLPTSFFAAEAVRIGRLSLNPEWKPLLDLAISVRERAILEFPVEALKIYDHYQLSAIESERKFALTVIFEERKIAMDLDEFAFEIFRNIGALIESVLLPYLKEFYGLLVLGSTSTIPVSAIDRLDMGGVVSAIDTILPDTHLLRPRPGDIRINQWRNIAQHTSYSLVDGKIQIQYGKHPSIKIKSFTREEMFEVARELMYRVSIFKATRELSFINHRKLFHDFLMRQKTQMDDRATMIAATISTRGFILKSLVSNEGLVTAHIEDLSESVELTRATLCSCFLLDITNFFPESGIEILFDGNTSVGSWKFSISRTEIEQVQTLENFQEQFFDIISIQRLHR